METSTDRSEWTRGNTGGRAEGADVVVAYDSTCKACYLGHCEHCAVWVGYGVVRCACYEQDSALFCSRRRIEGFYVRS